MTQCDLVWRLVALRVLYNVQMHCEDDRTNERTSFAYRANRTSPQKGVRPLAPLSIRLSSLAASP